ncbi:MAG: hypothetical protein V8R81_03720 [Clostridia bacterium]
MNDYEIDFANDDLWFGDMDFYKKSDVYEAQLYKKQPFEYINKKIKKDRVEIVKLFGNNNEL